MEASFLSIRSLCSVAVWSLSCKTVWVKSQVTGYKVTLVLNVSFDFVESIQSHQICCRHASPWLAQLFQCDDTSEVTGWRVGWLITSHLYSTSASPSAAQTWTKNSRCARRRPHSVCTQDAAFVAAVASLKYGLPCFSVEEMFQLRASESVQDPLFSLMQSIPEAQTSNRDPKTRAELFFSPQILWGTFSLDRGCFCRAAFFNEGRNYS